MDEFGTDDRLAAGVAQDCGSREISARGSRRSRSGRESEAIPMDAGGTWAYAS